MSAYSRASATTAVVETFGLTAVCSMHVCANSMIPCYGDKYDWTEAVTVLASHVGARFATGFILVVFRRYVRWRKDVALERHRKRREAEQNAEGGGVPSDARRCVSSARGYGWMALLKLLDWYAIFFYRVSIPLFTVTLYLWCGAVIFEALESPGETSAQNTFILNMDCLRNNTSNETYSGLETLVGNPDMYPWADWDFFGSYFFAYTLITTIGYGVFTPQTAGGKIFTSFFALLGIPFFILQVGDLGQAYIEIGFQWYLDWVGAAARRRVGQFDEIDHNHSGSFTKEDFEHRLNESGMWLMVHRVDALCEASDADHSGTIDKEEHDKVLDEVASIVKQRAQFIIAFTITTLIVLGNSFIWVPAGWSSADGFYCTMVTYLTVGLGDYVWPMQTSESLYGKSLQVAYFITSGIGLVAMVLSSSQIVVDEFRSMRRHYFPHLRLSMEDPFMPKTRSSSRAQTEGSANEDAWPAPANAESTSGSGRVCAS